MLSPPGSSRFLGVVWLAIALLAAGLAGFALTDRATVALLLLVVAAIVNFGCLAWALRRRRLAEAERLWVCAQPRTRQDQLSRAG